LFSEHGGAKVCLRGSYNFYTPRQFYGLTASTVAWDQEVAEAAQWRT